MSAAVGAFITVAISAQEAIVGAAGVFELRHGVVVDRGRNAIYVGEPAGGIEAVDLSTGQSMWRSAEAALPLALDGGLLIAQVEESFPGPTLRLVALDVDDKGRKVMDAVVPLPDDVQALVTDTLERSFRTTVERANGGLLVSWSYRETPVQGVARPTGEPRPIRRRSGAARVDVLSGRLVVAAPDTATRPPVVDSAAERLMTSNRLAHLPWQAGDVFAITEGGGGGPLTLKRWNAVSGAPLSDRLLMERALVALPSVDTSHVLASERVGRGGPSDPEYRWAIFSLETGELVGALRQDTSGSRFFVSRDIIVFEAQPSGFRTAGGSWVEEPLRMTAVSLPGGGVAWTRALRDLEYRGLAPPQP